MEHTVTAHSGGLQALDARGNFVATCGYGMRLGQVALDNMVKVRHPASLHLCGHASASASACIFCPSTLCALLCMAKQHAGTSLLCICGRLLLVALDTPATVQ